MAEEIIYGRNSVLETLTAKTRKVYRLIISESAAGNNISKIKELSTQQGILLKRWSKKKLDVLCGTDQHQGVVAFVSKRKVLGLQDLLNETAQKNEPPFLLVLDRLADPRNLGALIRTADAAGVHGMILSRHESSGLTPTVAKASAGAIEYVPIVQVSNLAMACDTLQKKGVWLFGADPLGEPYWKGTDFKRPVTILLGSEGSGLKNILKKKCDYLISIPMRGHISSLNVATAGAILMYEVVKQRNL